MENSLKLIFKSTSFVIPSDFKYLPDVSSDIYQSLMMQKKYYVKSDISESILQSFINYWTKREIPDIKLYNLFEFEQLSQEFDIMKPVIQTFRKIASKSLPMYKNKELNRIKSEKIQNLNQNEIKYQQNIQYLLKSSRYSIIDNDPKDKMRLKDAISTNNTKMTRYLTRKLIDYKEIQYSLNEDDFTAVVLKQKTRKREIFIPRAINFESHEFIVTAISETSFVNALHIQRIVFPENSEIKIFDQKSFVGCGIQSIKIPNSVVEIGEKAFFCCQSLTSVEFTKDSELKTIESSVFKSTPIKSIELPSKVSELKKSWLFGTDNLTGIKVAENNPNIINYQSKFLLGKSDPKSDNFDVLLLAFPDLKDGLIPSFIKVISSYSFEKCKDLREVKFSEDSQLKIIESNAFYSASIERLIIPPSLEVLENGWCAGVEKLIDIKIMKNQKNFLNYNSDFILGKSDLKNDVFDTLVFARRNITSAVIPSSVKYIFDFAFYQCKQLVDVQFQENSELLSIGVSAFCQCSFRNLTIPKHAFEIKENCFSANFQLNAFKVPDDSELKYMKNAFLYTSIKNITIPSDIDCDDSFVLNEDLRRIELIPRPNQTIAFYDNSFLLKKSDPKSDTFDVLFFALKNIKIARIPSFVKIIGKRAFKGCEYLKSIEFSDDSQLKLIQTYAFFKCFKIKKISFPSSVEYVAALSFCNCPDLKEISFAKDSKLEIIDSDTFTYCGIESLLIPSSVEAIKEDAFKGCAGLGIIEIPENSKLKEIDLEIFKGMRYMNYGYRSKTSIISIPHELKKILVQKKE